MGAAPGDSREGPSAAKNRAVAWSSNRTSGYVSKGNETRISARSPHHRRWTKTRKRPVSAPMMRQKMGCAHAAEYYLAKRKEEILPLATPWVDLEAIVLSEIRQTQEASIV